jgi:hypothetical protein
MGRERMQRWALWAPRLLKRQFGEMKSPAVVSGKDAS